MQHEGISFRQHASEQGKRALALLLCCTITWTSLPAWAQVAPTGNPAGQQPGQQVAANGVPVVDIVAPNDKGLSHNRYSRFDVGPNGLILNNSGSISRTQLGGYVAGNENLAHSGPATLILNEVTSTRSNLQGYTEIAGAKAQLVIANPNGISCDGCGFLNASRVTLATGTPNLNADGSLAGFDVRAGRLSIGTNGLDAYDVDRLDLLSRQLEVGGEVWARDLFAAAGSQRIGYGGVLLDRLPAQKDGTPAIGIDVAYLGGMYANRIRLVATEDGVGVVSRGTLAAQAGGLNIDSNGQLTLDGTHVARDRVQLQATGALSQNGVLGSQQGDVQLRAQDVTVAGDIVAAGALDATATGNLDQRGRLSAGPIALRGANVQLGGQLYSSGVLDLQASQVLTGDAVAYAGRDASLRAAYLQWAGTLQSAGAIALTGEQLLVGGVIDAGTTLRLDSSGELNVTGLAQAWRDASLHAGGALTMQGQVAAGGRIDASARDYTSTTAGTLSAGDDLVLSANGQLRNDGVLYAAGNLDLGADQIDNAGASYALGNVVTQSNALRNDGSLVGAKSLSVAAVDIHSRGELGSQHGAASVQGTGDVRLLGDTSAATTLDVSAGAQLQVDGTLAADTALLRSTGDMTLAGALQVRDELGAHSGANLRNDALVAAGQTLQLQAAQQLQQAGKLQSGGTLALTGENVDSVGVLDAAGDLALTASESLLLSGTAQTAGRADLAAVTLQNRAQVIAAAGLSVNATHIDNQADGQLASQGDAELNAGQLDNAGVLQAGGNLRLQADSLSQTATAATYAGHALDVQVGGLLDNQGQLVARADLQVQAGTLHSNGQLGSETGAVTLTSQGELSLDGVVQAAQALHADAMGELRQAGTLKAQSVVLRGESLAIAGDVQSTSTLDLQAQRSLALDGQALAGSEAMLAGDIIAIGNTAVLQSGGGITLDGADIDSRGTLDAGTDLLMLARGDIALAGAAQAGSDVRLDAQGRFDNNAQVLAGRDLIIHADEAGNSNTGLLLAQNDARLDTQGLFDNAGIVRAGRDLALDVGALNQTGQIYAARALQLTARAAVSNAGDLIGGTSLDLEAGTLSSRGQLGSESGVVNLRSHGDAALEGHIAAQSDLNVIADGALTQRGQLSALGNLALSAGGDLEVAGELAALNVDLHSDATLRQQGAISGGTIALGATRIELGGQSVADGSLILRGNDIDIAGTLAAGIEEDGSLGNNGTLVIEAGGQLASSGQWLVGGTLDASAARMALAGSQIRASGDATLRSNGAIDHRGGDLLVGGTLAIQAGGTLDNGRLGGTGGSLQAARLDLSSGVLSNVGGRVVQSGDGTTGLAFLRIDNSEGLLASNTHDLSIAADTLVNRGGRIEHAGTGTLKVHSNGEFDNSNGQLLTQGQLDVSAQGALRNEGGTLAAADVITLAAFSLDNRNGNVSANGLDLRVTDNADNRNGLLQSAGGNLTLQAGSLDNRTGTVQAISGNGGGDVRLELAQGLDNSGGLIGASNDLVLSAQTLRNDTGVVQAGRDLSVSLRGQLDNQNGRFSAARDVGVEAGAALLNNGGQIDGGRALAVSGASIVNTGGRIVNNGSGATTITTTGQLDNRGGDVGGNGGVVLTANDVLNGDGGELAAAGDLTVHTANLDNRGGNAYAGASFALQQDGAVLDNRGGTLKAEQALRLRLAQLYNSGGQIGAGSTLGGAGDVVIDSIGFDGGGSILAQNLLDLTLRGNYTHGPGADLASNGSFRLDVRGDLVNEGNLQAVRALQVSANNLVNRGGATIASVDTRISVGGNLDNAGDIAGNQTLQLTASSINNTGSIVGGNVLLQANTLTNGADLGSATDNPAYASGLIGATGDMTLLVRDRLLNRDAHIFSLGDISIGAARDGNGTLTARTGVVDNLSGSIEADGAIAIAAGAINNRRRWLQVATGALTPEEQAAANAELPGEELLVADTIQAPANATFPTRYEGHAPGTWRSYSVVSRDRLLGASSESKIVAGGNVALSGSVTNNASTIAAAGALLINQRGVAGLADGLLTGAEQVANQSLSLAQTVRQSDTKYVVRGVTNDCMQPVGRPLVCYYETDITELGSSDLASSYTALAATMSGAQGVAISGADIYNGAVGSDGRRIEGATLANSGPQRGLNGRGQQAAQDVAGRTVDGEASSTASVGQVGTHTNGRGLADVQAQAVGDRLQANAAPGALANIQLPIGGLYRLVGANGSDPRALGRAAQELAGVNAARGNGPGRRYLIETDPRFVDYNNFISSDYLLDKLGIDPEWTLTRLGDGFYEERLVLDQITQLTGSRYLGDYADGVAQYRALLEAGSAAAGQLQLSVGVGLTAAQAAALTQDIVWLVEQEYAGQTVLVPVVYLAGNSMQLRDNGALIAGGNVSLDAANGLTNNGAVRGADISMSAQNLLNQGSIAGTGSVVLQAREDLLNLGGQISGQNVGLAAGNDLRSEALAGVGSGSKLADIRAGNNLQLVAGHDLAASGTTLSAGNSAALSAGNDLSLQPTALRQEDGLLRGGQGVAVQAGNDLLLQAGRDLSVNGAQVHAGSDATLLAGRDLSLTPSQGLGEQSGTRTSLTTGGDLRLGAGNDITIRQAEVAAGGDLIAAAGHDLSVESTLEDPRTVIDRTRNGGTRTTVTTTTQDIDQQALSAGGNLVLSAGHDVNLVAARLEAGDGLAVAAGNDINSSTLTTVDSQDTLETRKRFKQTTSTVDETVHGTTFSAGGDIALQAGRDIDLAAASVHSDDGSVGLTAGRDVNLLAEQEQHDAVQDMEKKKKGFLSSKTTTTHDEWHESYAVTTAISGDSVQINAGNDVSAVGATVLAEGDVRIAAGNNVTLESAQDTYSEAHSSSQKKSGFSAGYSGGVASVGYGKSKSSSESSTDSVLQVGSSVASTEGNVVVSAGNQLTIAASDLAAGGNLTLAAKDIDLLARQDTVDTHATQSSKSSSYSLGVTLNPIEAYQSARDATTQNMPDSGSALGDLSRAAEGTAAGSRAATTSVVVQGGSQRANAAQDHSTSDARVSQLAAGGNLTLLASDGSITSQGAQMSAEGNALLMASQDIVFDVAHNLESSSSQDKGKGWSFANNTSGLPFGNYNQKGNGDGLTDTITGTQLSVGGNASLSTTQGDISLAGSNVVADGNVSMAAAGDLTLRSGQDVAINANKSDDKAIGTVVISDTERFMGYHTERHSDDSALVSQVASSVGSLGGNVSLSAGGQYSQIASNVVAAKDVDITAASIEVLAASENSSASQQDKSLKVGVFGRVNSPLIDLINNVEAARESDGRLQAMQGMAAAANAYQAASGAVAAMGGPGSGTLASAEAGFGVATEQSQYQGQSQISQGSTISGGGNVSLTTTQGDLHVVQGNLSAGNALSLDSARDLVLEAGQSNSSDKSSGHNAGVEVGVGASVGAQTGVYVYAQASVGSHRSSSDDTTYQNTQLAGQTINLSSQGDTTLRGAVGKANTINVDVGGDLTIESLQDVATSQSKESGAGGRVQVSFGTAWSASGNAYSSSTSGNYAGVAEQSGLFAGDGGYHVNAGNVNLVGGAITSTNADKSELTAQTLTYSDLHNSMDYSASSASLSGGYGADKQADGSYTGGANLGGAAPMHEQGDDASTTYATLTEGRITLGGVTGTAADTGIHVDASSASTAVKELPDLQKLLAEQQAMSAAAGTVVAAGQQVAGDLAESARIKAEGIREAYLADLAENDPAARAAFELLSPADQQAQLLADSPDYQGAYSQQLQWGVGGDYSRALQAVTTAVVGGMSGQAASQAAANALAPYAAQLIGQKFDEAHGSDPNAAAQLLSHALLGAVLAEVNGASGVGGAVAGAGGELAAKYLTQALYGDDPTAIDPVTGEFNANLLSEDKKQNVVALSQAVGVLAGGLTGDLNAAGIGSDIAGNAVENNFLGKADQARLDALRAKSGTEGLTTQESRELVYLEVADQIGDGLLQRYRTGEQLTAAEQQDLSIYLGAYAQQNGVEATKQLIQSGPSPTYTYPYAGLGEDKRTYADANFSWDSPGYTWAEVLLGHNQSANEQIFNDARSQGGFNYNGVRNEGLTPSAQQAAKFLAVYDTLAGSPAASIAYLGATAAGASAETRDALTLTVGQLAQIGSAFILSKANLSPVFGETVSKPAGGAAWTIDNGSKQANDAVLGANAGSREIKLVDGFYQVEGSQFKFSTYYYERLWSTGRGAPFIQADEVLRTATKVAPDRMPGFYRYTNGAAEMIYNPTTKEVWHLQPVR